jgi:2-dehydro-3-deoxyphosphogalactonate aldolase
MAVKQQHAEDVDVTNRPLTEWLRACPLVAILRGVKPSEVEAIGDALVECGVTIIEVPLNSPDPIDSIARLVMRFGDRLLIGAGTVTTAAQVSQIAAAGFGIGSSIYKPGDTPLAVRAKALQLRAALPH